MPIKLDEQLKSFIECSPQKELLPFLLPTSKVENQFRDLFAFYIQKKFENKKIVVGRETTFQKNRFKDDQYEKGQRADLVLFQKKCLDSKDEFDLEPIAVIELKAGYLFDCNKPHKGKRNQLHAFCCDLNEQVNRWKSLRNSSSIKRIGILLISNIDFESPDCPEKQVIKYFNFMKQYQFGRTNRKKIKGFMSKTKNLKKYEEFKLIGKISELKENNLISPNNISSELYVLFYEA